jgi:hypothetical protein
MNAVPLPPPPPGFTVGDMEFAFALLSHCLADDPPVSEDEDEDEYEIEAEDARQCRQYDRFGMRIAP